jgi:hypothetical protein
MSQGLSKLRLIALGVFALAWAHVPPSDAADCGGTRPCACGDNVTESRTLISGKVKDPVLKVVCTGDGLILNTPGVVLNLKGGKIRGSETGTGLLIEADGVTILDGRVDKFETGVGGATNGSTVDTVKPYYNEGDGILLAGDGNTLIDSPARHNGNNGIWFVGDNNTFSGGNNEYNALHGFVVEGNGNNIVANQASENRKGGTGMIVIGDGNVLRLNNITKLNTDGIVVEGDDNTLIQNSVTKQKRDGIRVSGDGNVLTENAATANSGTGIKVVGDRNEAVSTGNRVSLNRINPQCEIYGDTDPPACIQEMGAP